MSDDDSAKSRKRDQDASAQSRRRQKMQAKGMKQVTVWVPENAVLRLRSYASQLAKGNYPTTIGSDRQIEWAMEISERIGMPIPTKTLASYRLLSRWIGLNRYAPSCQAWMESRELKRAALMAELGEEQIDGERMVRPNSPLCEAQELFRSTYLEWRAKGRTKTRSNEAATRAAVNFLKNTGYDLGLATARSLFILPEEGG